jgi:hypothetical protein
MAGFFTVWITLALVGGGLALLGSVATIWAAATLWRLQRDHRTLQAAEQLVDVDLTTVITRYVPLALRSNAPDEEIALAGDRIDTQWRRCKTVVICSAVIAVCAAGASGFSIERNPRVTNASREAPQIIEIVARISGVWGMPHDATRSCLANPTTIGLEMNQTVLSTHFPKPLWNGDAMVGGVDYYIVGTEHNTFILVLLKGGMPVDPTLEPVQWFLVFDDDDAFHMWRNDGPVETFGQFARCR